MPVSPPTLPGKCNAHHTRSQAQRHLRLLQADRATCLRSVSFSAATAETPRKLVETLRPTPCPSAFLAVDTLAATCCSEQASRTLCWLHLHPRSAAGARGEYSARLPLRLLRQLTPGCLTNHPSPIDSHPAPRRIGSNLSLLRFLLTSRRAGCARFVASALVDLVDDLRADR